ncbi:chaperone protein dnaJ 11, chloroplastic-like [Lolium rigidum]|uniref:chaperone protein dnaJ 11, chloroplastic-like n=1 Tax=Lolium rigidum TaxID=89674 RepID=UPI001F5D3C48|nr:chaperone protein dnaJ 11, chloroplastic-like [Lolium rigidum]
MISAPPLMQAPPAAAGFRRASPCSSRRATVRCAVAVASAPPAGRCTLYEVLGLQAGATGGEIKAAYRRLARELHPDVAGAAGDSFIRLHDAYATLSDPDARARYDRDVVANAYAQPPASRPSPHSFWGRPRRTWETDQCW